MKKTLKIIFCSLVIVTILTANVFASGWAGYTPYFSNFENLYFDETVSSVYSATELENVVNRAYDLGMFGGAIPIAITQVEMDTNAYGVNVICVVPIGNAIEPNTLKSSAYGYIYDHGGGEYSIAYSVGDLYTQQYMATNGDYATVFQPGSGMYALADNEEILLIKDQNGNWYYDDNSSIFAQFHNVNANVNTNLVSIADTYESALNGYTPPSPPSPPSEPSKPSEPSEPPVYVQYMLDIPSIISAIPNAAKQIINNSFGFEIFGINVAGLLSVLLVVTIVAFVVKWLMSR